jgi:uncharacterized protein involved in exopolysaccharide biosynthesis
MTELETHLLNAFKQLEQQSRQRDQLLANTLDDLSKQFASLSAQLVGLSKPLADGAIQNANLSNQLRALNARIENLLANLNRR